MVIVVGPSKAGKTRTVFEAVRDADPTAVLLWPVIGGTTELAAHPRVLHSEDTIVVWLDDLQDYLNGIDALTPKVLAQLSARPGRTMVVATLRSEMRARLRADGELQRDTRLLLEQAEVIDLASTSEDSSEQAAAAAAYPDQCLDGYGLGEVLAGAPELLHRYDDAAEADPPQHAVIEVAIDWARIGRQDPIPEPVLAEFTMSRLRTNRPELDIAVEDVLAAISAARQPPKGAGRAAALRTSYLDDQTRVYRPFDYLVAADDGQDHRTPRLIPDTFWDAATHSATIQTLVSVGYAAYQRGLTPRAATLMHQAAEGGDVDAMRILGNILRDRGELVEAESWFRKAIDAGEVGSMWNLGMLQHDRGEWVGAESWFRKAIDAGDKDALWSLADLLHDRGDLAGAESWFREAIDAGNIGSMWRLGLLLRDRGELVEAESWFRKAIDAGDSTSMWSLGHLLHDRGEWVGAESWFRKAIDAGVNGSMWSLGNLLRDRGVLMEAESWFRKAIDGGHVGSMRELGKLLHARGELIEATSWFRKAIGAGDTSAKWHLGIVLRDRAALAAAEAEAWSRGKDY
ncbi:tetratricopeptide repeat protein [Nocardia sp. NPDC004722]